MSARGPGRHAGRRLREARPPHSDRFRCGGALSTAFRERKDQSERLATIVHDRRISAPKIVLGDFNEWSRGFATAVLSEKLQAIDLSVHLRRKRTYPGILPFLHLDHIYYEGHVDIAGIDIPRTRKSLIASDHLPFLAELRVGFD